MPDFLNKLLGVLVFGVSVQSLGFGGSGLALFYLGTKRNWGQNEWYSTLFLVATPKFCNIWADSCTNTGWLLYSKKETTDKVIMNNE